MVCELKAKTSAGIDVTVLILVLMEYGLRDRLSTDWDFFQCLNPCFNGIWSARLDSSRRYPKDEAVLILVLMEYGLRGSYTRTRCTYIIVLILVLMEYGLREAWFWLAAAIKDLS